jgi:hypothetical protein
MTNQSIKSTSNTTATAYKARMSSVAAEITNRREPLIRQADGLRGLIALGRTPEVPGFGYRSVRRWRRRLYKIEQQIQSLDPEIIAFLGEDFNDISLKRQAERQQFLVNAAKQWEIDNPLPTIN